MSDYLVIQPFATQLRRILKEFEATRSIFGLHESLFHRPRPDAPYALDNVFGKRLATPIGPSAGPHTQLSQNIVAAWLCGGRFMELKTVQMMDELDIPRPCIDMEDEGYNVEWSQELKLEESAHEYVVAWALVHVLPRILGWDRIPGVHGSDGTIFDFSVGYNLEGIQSPRVRAFMDTLENAAEPLSRIAQTLRADFPQFADIAIPARIANSITLSTMHGCPPDEIEKIATYLLSERKLHTLVKLNPTLLGRDDVRSILKDHLGYGSLHIGDAVFDHDIAYDKAIGLIRRMQALAAKEQREFGVKLSNTLAMTNWKRTMPGDEMYMSGRALYPITMNLFAKLMHEFDGRLRVSYSAGADALNVATIASCGPVPITGCSDLLKPGGYARLRQWLDNLEGAMHAAGATSLAAFAQDNLVNVKAAAAESLANARYKKAYNEHGLPKVKSGLGLWDCVVAPCMEACAVCQHVPEYSWWIAQGDCDKALATILARNPLPGITGYACTRLCQTRCVRNDYDESVAIRALKRYAEENGSVPALVASKKVGRKVAVIGSGPSGWSAAFHLALSGIDVDIHEAKDVIGGMTRMVPVFRLPWEIVQRDIDRITALGVNLKLNSKLTGAPEALLSQGYDAVFVATGFQNDARLDLPGIEGDGVIPALALLDRTRRGERLDLGRKALVIGGGDTAMDAVRTSARLTGNATTIVYRRTRHEMPASREDLEGALDEGNELLPLTTPLRVVRDARGKVTALECLRNELGEPGPDGRRKPVAIPGSTFEIPCDMVIIAVGQDPAFEFLADSVILRDPRGGIAVDPKTGTTAAPGVYAGGDAAEAGPASIIAACDDGRRAAESICWQFGVPFHRLDPVPPGLSSADIVAVKRERARKTPQMRPAMRPVPARKQSFDLIEMSFTREQAQAEARRCLQCTSVCDKCVEVCPNRANATFAMRPLDVLLPSLALRDGKVTVVGHERFRIEQSRQIVNINDFCNACGDCTSFCVHQGQPWKDKPRLFLNEKDFLAEDYNAYRVTGNRVRHRHLGRETSLTREHNGFAYESPELKVTLSRDFTVASCEAKHKFSSAISMRDAAEMSALLEGLSASQPQLLIE